MPQISHYQRKIISFRKLNSLCCFSIYQEHMEQPNFPYFNLVHEFKKKMKISEINLNIETLQDMNRSYVSKEFFGKF